MKRLVKSITLVGFLVLTTGPGQAEEGGAGITHPVPGDYYRKPGYIVQLDSETWAALYLSSTDLGKVYS